MKLSFLFVCTALCSMDLFAPPMDSLFAAIGYGTQKDIDKFIKDVNLQQNGATPLMAAIEAKKGLDLVEKLLNAGAKVNTQDNNGATAYDFALHNNQIKVAKKLRDAGGKSGMDL